MIQYGTGRFLDIFFIKKKNQHQNKSWLYFSEALNFALDVSFHLFPLPQMELIKKSVRYLVLGNLVCA